MAVCIVISGPPCAGKSAVAARVAARGGWPLLAKDDYKECVFEHLGIRDRAWSRRVSALAWDLLVAEAGRLLGAGVSCVLEGNLRAPQRRALAALAVVPAPRFIEIRANARPAVLLERYHERVRAGLRHPGHVDLEALPDIEHELAAPPAIAPLGGPLLDWDTSAGFVFEPLLAALDAALATVTSPASDTRGSASSRSRSRRGS